MRTKTVLKELLLVMLTALIAVSLFACGEEEVPPAEQTEQPMEDIGMTATMIITDGAGVDRTLKIELYPDKAPISVENFKTLANNGFYDGLCFHRIVPSGCLQGGGYKVEGNSIMEAEGNLTPIKGEFASNGWNANADIKHEFGTISMARTSVKDSATSQFFLVIGSYPSWDGEYAAFGKIIDAESKANLTELGKSTYANVGGGLSTFPYPLITIKSVRVA